MRSRTPIIAGVLITPVALFAAIASAGAGHGTYLWAKIFFPYTMISSVFYQTSSAPRVLNVLLWIVFPIVQYPLYGIILSLANRNRRTAFTIAGLCVLHLAVVTLNFVVPNPNFS